MIHKKISGIANPNGIFSEQWKKQTLFKSRLDLRSPFFDLKLRSSNEERIQVLNNKTKY